MDSVEMLSVSLNVTIVTPVGPFHEIKLATSVLPPHINKH